MLPRPCARDRLAAFVEVLLCSGLPTQVAVTFFLHLAGYQPLQPDGRLSLAYVVALTLGDAALLTGLIFVFIRLHDEPAREVFLGARPIRREALVGVPLTALVFLFVLGILALIQRVAPSLHNVPRNPLEDLIRSPRDAWLFGIVAIVAGGAREEIQRAFILRRFERYLGGGPLGLVLFSLMFGLGHAIQGWDAAIATAMLGACWGAIYLLRRSIVAPVVSHAGFNAAEIVFYRAYGLGP